MIMLSGVGHTNLKNTLNWLLEASKTIEIKPKKASGPLIHLVILPKKHGFRGFQEPVEGVSRVGLAYT